VSRDVSPVDNLAFNLFHVVPGALQGTFSKRPRFVRLFSRAHPDPLAVRFVSRLRRKYRSDYLYVSLLGKRSLLVLDVDGIRHVLGRSPDVYADPRAKRLGMGHFQPNALTISRGEEWRERRRFNEEVLAYKEPLHPLAGAFLSLVKEEVRSTLAHADGQLGWPELSGLFERVALGVIFGPEARSNGSALSHRLTRMMQEANRIFGLKESADFKPFYDEVSRRLEAPAAPSLVAGFAAARPRPETAAANQVPHWIFATRDTLPANTLNALALIVSHPATQERVRTELKAADLATPEGIERLRYLQACMDEAMRLWPTTMMLVREVLVDDTLGGETIPAGTQVVIHNGFNHRNPDAVPEPDQFLPERWIPPRKDYRFNHMSNGTQSCVGRKLALFLGKAVLAELLSAGGLRLVAPALVPDRPIPHGVDTYGIRLDRARGA
jgi:cytochrome P450